MSQVLPTEHQTIDQWPLVVNFFQFLIFIIVTTEIMLPKLIKVQMSVPNGDSTQLPSQGFATNNSKKLFEVSYPGGQIVWRDLHVAKDRSQWIPSDELFQTGASPSRRILKCQRLDQGCGHRSSHSLRKRQHRCGNRISSHWWIVAVRSSRY